MIKKLPWLCRSYTFPIYSKKQWRHFWRTSITVVYPINHYYSTYQFNTNNIWNKSTITCVTLIKVIDCQKQQMQWIKFSKENYFWSKSGKNFPHCTFKTKKRKKIIFQNLIGNFLGVEDIFTSHFHQDA